MNASIRWSYTLILTLGTALAHATEQQPREQAPLGSPVTEQVRKELLEARETAWKSFFQKDQTRLDELLAPELIAIQQHTDQWDDRPRLLKMARAMNSQGAQLLRLEFPRTQIQLFGDTAILYYTYVFEMAIQGRSSLDAGRGTEIFVRRKGKWVDVGWHIDNGAFARKGEQWVRTSEPLPAPTAMPASQP